MDMPIENAHRSKPLQISQSLGGVLCPPAPLFVDGPKRHVRKDHDWCAAAQAGDILFHPFQLLISENSQCRLPIGDIGDIHQTNEMNTLVIEALVSRSFRAFAETLK